MPASDLNDEQIRDVIQRERVVRVAFRDATAAYVIPLGYVALGTSLYGVTDRGRKSELAEANPSVGLQIDTSASTGVWEWSSVTGEGMFSLVTDAEERQGALVALQPVIAEAPPWWQREQGPRMAAGELEVWTIAPTRLGGRRYAPAE